MDLRYINLTNVTTDSEEVDCVKQSSNSSVLLLLSLEQDVLL